MRLRTVAQVGSESSMLAAQLATLPASYRADVAVIVVGGNDVTHRVPVSESVRHLEEAIASLRARGTAVVVGTCPDLGALRPVPQPLRALGSRASRQLAQAQEAAAVRAGAHAVSLAHVVGPFFITNPDEMFSLDRFHPSAAGYKRTAKALLPSLLAALGLEGGDLPFGHSRPAAPVTTHPVAERAECAHSAPRARSGTRYWSAPATLEEHGHARDQAARLAQLAVRPRRVRGRPLARRLGAPERPDGRLAGRAWRCCSACR